MGKYKSKKNKKQDDSVKTLAEQILKQSDIVNDEETVENGESDDIFNPHGIIEPLEDIKRSKGKIPSNDNNEIATPPPSRIILERGLVKSNAFVINRREDEIYTILRKYFGNKNGDYFVGSENTHTSYINGVRKRYKCINIEDKNKFTYTVWFDLTNLGLIY